MTLVMILEFISENHIGSLFLTSTILDGNFQLHIEPRKSVICTSVIYQ